MHPNPKRPRLEAGVLTVYSVLTNITNTQNQRNEIENREKIENEKRSRRASEQRQIFKQVKNFNNFIDRLNARQDENFEVICRGSVQVIDKKTGIVKQHYFPTNPQENGCIFLSLFLFSKSKIILKS